MTDPRDPRDPYAHYRANEYTHQQGYTTTNAQTYASQPPNTPNVPAPAHGGPNWRWWIPGDGIRRDVIQADIQRYLGSDALVKPGNGTGESANRPGYWIAAYRTLTTEMVADLRTDSANFERSGARGSYQESQVHQSRQYWGPTAPTEHSNPTPVAPTPYIAGAPAAQSYATAPTQPPNYPYTGSSTTNPAQQYSTPAVTQSGYTGQQAATANPASNYSGTANYGVYPGNAAPSGNNASYQPSSTTGHTGRDRTTPRTTHTHAQDSQYARPSQQTYTQQQPQSAAAPAGYYLASDGNYYPLSAQR